MARSIILMLLTLIVVPSVQCTRYMIYPIDRKDIQTCLELHNKLIEFLGKPAIILRSEFKDRGITDFWLVNASPDRIAYIKHWTMPPQYLVSDKAWQLFPVI